MKKLFYILIPILLLSCKSDAELAMERGIQLYDWDKLDEALNEFSKVKYLLDYEKNPSMDTIELLAQAKNTREQSDIKTRKMNFARDEKMRVLS